MTASCYSSVSGQKGEMSGGYRADGYRLAKNYLEGIEETRQLNHISNADRVALVKYSRKAKDWKGSRRMGGGYMCR